MKDNKNNKNYNNKKHKDREPDDGTFISYKENEEFNSNGSSRYGYEQDSCDL
ncbi:MAG: hypothetical protein E7J22_12380 [Clostridium perfringens]|uniref:hypothetical protein n=1 Tax=Clostridium perfringens TaxID=1502 RepID=UPI0013E32E53|nr:hypothetical protein [Clostridium perfringens]MCI2777942.1 hypothetical protein [Clostridium perfringens]MDU7887413.1 hypothetical protein [Clostridium perfringens]MDU7955451.1 hypothetical protein [Clostridium perfringens]MDU7964947.1 hypothetical protein [Clostridium perfringens]NGU67288.1 hypothetical protein [Clostridium perfringens]